MHTPQPQVSRPPAKARLWVRSWQIVSLLIFLATTSAIRIRLLDLPLERDEGEYAYTAQLLLQGTPPYQQAYTLKFPGTPAAYALIMGVFGETATGIRTGLIVVNLATAILVFLLAARVCGRTGGAAAAGTYAFLSLSPSTLGLMAHATHFVMLPALAGIYLIQKPADRLSILRVAGAGALLGLAVLMKQSGAAFGIFAVVWLVRCEIVSADRKWRRLAGRLGTLIISGLFPLILTAGIFAYFGVLERFWFWTFDYAREYASIVTFGSGMENLFQAGARLFCSAPFLWITAAGGLVLLSGTRYVRRWRFFILCFTAFSFIAVCPGLYFRGHYFIQLLPAAGILAAVAIAAASKSSKFFSTRFPVMLLLVAFSAVDSLAKSSDIFFHLTPAQVSRALYGLKNPFAEAQRIGSYLALNCPENSTIAVIASEPEIYFYSRRRSATGYLYLYPLAEAQPYALQMREEMIREIEKAGPEYVVYNPEELLRRPKAYGSVRNWLERYAADNFELAGTAELLPQRGGSYKWLNPGTPLIPPRSKYWLAVLKKRQPKGGAAPAER